MPRRSPANVPFSSTATRVRPPDDLTGEARSTFCDLVCACRADHFHDSDIPLLVAFSRAVVLEKAASEGLKTDGYVTAEGRPSPWLPILQAATRTLSTFSRMLRLNPSARSMPSKPPEERPPISAYERIALEAHRDGRN